MKYLIIGVLFFATAGCFAVDQELINGVKKYETAIGNIKKIENSLTAQGYFGLWLSDEMRKFNPDYIDETDERWGVLGAQYNEAQKVIKKYEPIKNKYDKQIAREEEIKDTIQNVAIILVILSIFVSFFWFINYQHKKYKRLLKEGKITQEEYDRMIQSCRSDTFDDRRTNPATGLTMLGGCDSSGNAYGCSSNNNSTFDVHQDYADRHRWD